jgi:hypothetical protein
VGEPAVPLPQGVAATFHQPPFTALPELIVEGYPDELAEWAVREGAVAARRAGVDLRIATPALAEEGWRGGMRAASILLAGLPLAGPPLAARLRLPCAEILREQAATQAQGLLLVARGTLLGHRRATRDAALPTRLAAWNLLAQGGPLLGEERSLRAAAPALAEPDWARRALRVAR